MQEQSREENRKGKRKKRRKRMERKNHATLSTLFPVHTESVMLTYSKYNIHSKPTNMDGSEISALPQQCRSHSLERNTLSRNGKGSLRYRAS
jgi:hypothetical protein